MNKKISKALGTSSNKKIQSILDNFDFEQMNRVMVFMDWKWGCGENAFIPSVEDLKVEACRLLERTYMCEIGHSTGGFETEYSKGATKEILTLKFVAEEWFA